MMIIVMVLVTATLVCIGIAHFMPKYERIATIVMDCILGFACKFLLHNYIFYLVILLCIALAVFMINAEMLESRYLIGVNNVFPVRSLFNYIKKKRISRYF
jgi:hypothetical protein